VVKMDVSEPALDHTFDLIITVFEWLVTYCTFCGHWLGWGISSPASGQSRYT